MKILEQEISEFQVGKEIEIEHFPTLLKLHDYLEKTGTLPGAEQLAEWIAIDHISEFPNYYNDKTGLPAMEKVLKSEEN